MLFRAVAVLVLVSVFACGLRPAVPQPPVPPRRTNMQLGISSLALPNGLRVVLVRDPRASELQVTMRYQVGAADDPAGQEGIAHLVEHLMFQQIVGADSIFAKLENTARVFNAGTTYDATTFVTNAPVERLDALLAIEMVRMNARCASITEAVFAREREVVINEIRLRDYASELFTAMNRGVYPDQHPYTRLLGGTPATLAAITMAQACAFADAHYAPSNAVLVLSGNLDPAVVEAALTRTVHNVRPHPITAGVSVATPTTKRTVETNAPIDDDAVLLAWPLPADPELRMRLRSVFAMTVAGIDGRVQGRVLPVGLGDTHAEMLAVVIERVDDEPIKDILTAAQKGTDDAVDQFRVEGALGEIYFNSFQQAAIYAAFAAIEEGGDRDTRLAAHVAAGRAPDRALATELQSLRTLTADAAASLASTYFTYERANVVVLKASDRTRGATKLSVAAPIHDIGQRRDAPDPALAKEPAAEPLELHTRDGLVTRRLPNGMRVILAPVTSVPTIDARIVFGSGTADEPGSKRGAAILAGKGLEWRWRSLDEAVALTAVGANVSIDVGFDRTVFESRGLDMHLDHVLLGLRRAVRDGRYRTEATAVADALRKAAKEVDDDGALTDAWRVAVFGAGHPYAAAGIRRHVSTGLRVVDAMEFRAAHFTPDNATLVIAGRFDVDIANAWIDHLFSDWKGSATDSDLPRAAAMPVSLANDADRAQVKLSIALPAPGGTRAERLLAAAMLTEIAHDVRHQLGAAYWFDAAYEEQRLSSTYVISGAVDASRTHEAIALIKTRLEALHTDKPAAARAFVLARRRVLATLSATTGSAAAIGDRITQDITLGRPPLSDVALASEIHEITISAMSIALADLDLSRAAILMNGPAADVDRAFAVLGRTPTRLTSANVDVEMPPSMETPPSPEEEVHEVTDAPDEPELRLTFTLALTAGYVSGEVLTHEVSGSGIAAQIGYRLDETKAVGGRISIASVSAIYTPTFGPSEDKIEALPVSLGIFFQGTVFDRVHGSLFVSFDLNNTKEKMSDFEALWKTGLSGGLELGVDVLRVGAHRFTLYGRVEQEAGSGTSANYSAYSLGLGYRLF